MCAKNHLLIFSTFLDIWENVEWPRFFGPPGIWPRYISVTDGETDRQTDRQTGG